MSQKDIKLYQGNASPKDIVLRALEAAPLQARSTIYLYAGHATPSNVILRNPAEVPVVGGDVTGTIAWTQAGDTWALTGTALVAGEIAFTQEQDTWAANGEAAVFGEISSIMENNSWAISGMVYGLPISRSRRLLAIGARERI